MLSSVTQVDSLSIIVTFFFFFGFGTVLEIAGNPLTSMFELVKGQFTQNENFNSILFNFFGIFVYIISSYLRARDMLSRTRPYSCSQKPYTSPICYEPLCRWRLWGHFLIHITVSEFHRDKGF